MTNSLMSYWQQHVNNVVYVRYAEASRVNWVTHFASMDPGRDFRWRELMTPRGTGFIMKSLRADYKFVRPFTTPCGWGGAIGVADVGPSWV
jgi:hypothetical protein